jgi:transcriptional regulator with XRE-family HTH domain
MGDHPQIEQIIARKLREFRKLRGLTLTEFSRQTNISVASLSKLENAKISPPISIYARIAKVLEIPIGELFSERVVVPISIVKREERRAFTHSGGYAGESIAFKKPNKIMEPFVFTYLPGKNPSAPYQHKNEELIFVIEGELEFRYGRTKYILRTGDCAYLDGSHKHSARALGGKRAQALVVEAAIGSGNGV